MKIKKILFRILVLIMCAIFLTSCSLGTQGSTKDGASDASGAGNASAAAAGSASDSSVVSKVTWDNVKYEDDDAYSDWKTQSAINISFSGTAAKISGAGAEAEGSLVTITKAGVYVFDGKSDSGSITVDAGDKDTVRLVLNDLELQCKDGPAVYVKNAGKVIVSMPENTQNTLGDGKSYASAGSGTAVSDSSNDSSGSTGKDEPDAAIYSKSDLTFNGSGSLTVKGNYNNGIVSKDELRIMEGRVSVTAVDDGIVGKDMAIVRNGEITIDAGGDGIKATNDTDPVKGFTAFENGSFSIKAGADAIQAVTTVMVKDGAYVLTTGGGSANAAQKTGKNDFGPWGKAGNGQGMTGDAADPGNMGYPGSADSPDGTGSQSPDAGVDGTSGATAPASKNTDSAASVIKTAVNTAAPASSTTGSQTTEESESQSAKAIKSSAVILISGGKFTIDSSDDAIHSNDSINITGGDFTIKTGDDAVHADSVITIGDGRFSILKSYEGIESNSITISKGNISIESSDDGINAGAGSGSSRAGGIAGQAGPDTDGTGKLQIDGGYIAVNAEGDGLDVNGSGYMTGGTVIVNGPTSNGNGAMDYDGVFNVKGGLLIAAGSSGMAMAPSDDSAQYSVIMNFSGVQSAGTLVNLQDESGSSIITFKPDKQYQSVVISSPELKKNGKYTLYTGGTSNGSLKDGIYSGGKYQNGTKVTGFTITKITTWLKESGETTANQAGPGGHGGMGGQGGFRGPRGSGRLAPGTGAQPGQSGTQPAQGAETQSGNQSAT